MWRARPRISAGPADSKLMFFAPAGSSVEEASSAHHCRVTCKQWRRWSMGVSSRAQACCATKGDVLKQCWQRSKLRFVVEAKRAPKIGEVMHASQVKPACTTLELVFIAAWELLPPKSCPTSGSSRKAGAAGAAAAPAPGAAPIKSCTIATDSCKLDVDSCWKV